MSADRPYPALPLERLAVTLQGALNEFAITHCGLVMDELHVADQRAIYKRAADWMERHAKNIERDAVAEARREVRKAGRQSRNRDD